MKRQEQYQEILQKYLPEYIQAANKTYDAYMRNNPNASVLYTTTAYVAAPVLHAYIKWVLDDAMNRKIKRLYFLSRDGYQMLEAARLIGAEQVYNIELRYLHCSRYAFEIPSNHLRKDYLNRICTGGKAVYVEDVLRRGGLTEQEVETVIKSDSGLYRLSQKKEALSYRQIRELGHELVRNTYFCRLVMEHSRKAYPACIGYLRQEGLFDPISCAVVDSGWTGGMQELLNYLLQSAGHPRELDGYYFGLYDLPFGVRKDRYHAFYFNIWGDYWYKTFFNNNVYEVIFSAPEAMTVGYQKAACADIGIDAESKDGQWTYVPVYSDKQDLKMIEFYHQQIEIIRFFIKKTMEQDCNFYDTKRKRRTLKKGLFPILREFMCNPSRGEVKFYGAMRFSDHLLENGSAMLAEYLSIDQLRVNHLIPRIRAMLNGTSQATGYWLLGSLRHCSMTKQERKRQRRQILAYQYVVYIKKDLLRILRFFITWK